MHVFYWCGVAAGQSEMIAQPGLAEEMFEPACCHSGPACWTFRAEGLLWWTLGDQLPALLTTSPVGTPSNVAGNLDNPTTEILFGNDGVNEQTRGGMRFTLGRLVAPGMEVEASYLSLPEVSTGLNENSNARPILSRPFVDAVTGLNDHQAVAFPGTLTGSIDLAETSQFQTLGVTLKHELFQKNNGRCASRLHFLAGYRHARLEEALSIRSSTTVIGAAGVLVPGTELDVQDSFAAENQFDGVEFGLLAECAHGLCSWEFSARAALGNSRGVFAIDGSTTATVPGGGAPVTTMGGLLAQSTNIGEYALDQFAFVPEVGVKLRYSVCPNLRLTFGYNFIYWSDVLRPGSGIDTTLNLSQAGGGALVGPARPEFSFQDDHFWAQGLSFGLDYRF